MAVIPDQLRRLVALVPDEIGFTVVGHHDLTFREWDSAASRLARGLIARGVGKGDRVALVLRPDDGSQFVIAHTAAHKAGAVVVPVNVRLSPSEIGGILAHCEPAAVIVSDELAHLIAAAPPVPTVLTLSEMPDAMDDDDSDIQVDADLDDLAEILYTSGTTGTPKGVAIRHGNSAMQVLTEPSWSGGRWLHASPMFTFAGLTFVYQPMRMGMRTVYLPKFDADTWLDLVDEHKPMAAFLVPAMAELLAKHERFAQADLSSLFMVSVGSAPVAPSTLQLLQAAMPNAGISNSYSMTEAGTAYFVLPKGELDNHPGSCGLPIPPTRVRILREDGSDADVDEVGEVVVQPAGKAREYYRDPDATAALWQDGWLYSGDLGRLDADGYLYIVGRKKDMIIRGGYNVYAIDVEAVLYEHPAVLEAAVVGVPHDVLGEDIAAYVVLRDDTTLTAEELLAHCAERLADYKRPRAVRFLPALPRNATGKVLKRDLVDTRP